MAEGAHIAAEIAGVEIGTTALGTATVGGAIFAGAVPGALGIVSPAMALGSGWLEARQVVNTRASLSGFSQGFVAGLRGWTWRQVAEHLGRHYAVRKYAMDEANDFIEANGYNRGLKAGWNIASKLPPEKKKEFLADIRRYAGSAPRELSWRDRVDRIIELAGAMQANFMEEFEDD